MNEVHLRRLTVDEALLKLDKYLNDAFMAGLYQVRVVHGKGTGTLRQVVRKQLAKHPLVSSYRPGSYGEGGGWGYYCGVIFKVAGLGGRPRTFRIQFCSFLSQFSVLTRVVDRCLIYQRRDA